VCPDPIQASIRITIICLLYHNYTLDKECNISFIIYHNYTLDKEYNILLFLSVSN
jgi:hypothetical protein